MIQIQQPPVTAPVHFEVFEDHWKQAVLIFNKFLINDDDIEIVKNNLDQLISLLLHELAQLAVTSKNSPEHNRVASSNAANGKPEQPCRILEFTLRHNIFEVFYSWTLRYPEYLLDLKYEQMRHWQALVTQLQEDEQTDLLLCAQLHRPLFALLNHCASHKTHAIERHMIDILNQLCFCICKNEALLNIFFDVQERVKFVPAAAFSQPVRNAMQASAATYMPTQNSDATGNGAQLPQEPVKFPIFALLIPYIHREGSLGQQARDALLMIMQLSARNVKLARYIVDSTDFCPILATGLSALYSDLPQKLSLNEKFNFDEIRYLGKTDIAAIPSLNKFINSLEFCNNVIQVSHTLIQIQLLQYVYYGFLIPVVSPALTQDIDGSMNCVEEIITAISYFNLFLRTITEANLLKIFLKFVLYAKYDETSTTSLLDVLTSRINANNKLSIATLMFFYTLVDLNSEDVMYKLILVYLIPCRHLLDSQRAVMRRDTCEINGTNAQTFLELSTACGANTEATTNAALSMDTLHDFSPLSRWLNRLFDSHELSEILSYLHRMKFNFADYLKDAKSGIILTSAKSLKWTFDYDMYASNDETREGTMSTERGLVRRKPTELDFDPDEYLLNMNICLHTIADPFHHSAASIFGTDPSHDNTSLHRQGSTRRSKGKAKLPIRRRKTTDEEVTMNGIDATNCNEDEVQLSVHPVKGSKSRIKTRNDFYTLSFDNYNSSSTDDEENTDRSVSSDSPKNAYSTSMKKNGRSDDFEDEDLSTSNSSSMNQSAATQFEPSPQYRQELIDYLFSSSGDSEDENSGNGALNGNLNIFLSALDTFFADKDKQQLTASADTDLNALCDQILAIYNEQFNSVTVPLQLDNSEEKIEMDLPSDEPVQLCNGDHTTQFSQPTERVTREAAIGPFLCQLLDRFEQMPNNSLQVNFLLTGLLARLAYYPHLLLRSFLLSHSLLVQSNIKPLIQVLGNLKVKIDTTAQSSPNFSLLYLKARLFLIHRLIEKQPDVSSSQINIKQSRPSTPNASPAVQLNLNGIPTKKRFSFDRLLKFFKLDPSFNGSGDERDATTPPRPRSPAFSSSNGGLKSPNVEIHLKNIKLKFNKNDTPSDFISSESETHQKESVPAVDADLDDFVQIEAAWNDAHLRSIAYSAVIYDEFVKELAAICQEHSILTQ